ncbi:3-octaprenyl-4-hydroxybenzoate carboxy-lyase [Ferroglobus placidus DSM 10642]|uniref:Flavin prenyltransferase UbiX n=1 Tax=Ferroglobus placidus (strain DSM 10642 / AEDII12DO) TaxID=589924 RepID=D3S145_FERPA|nr:UbiX family flavin prenyltransferase [Ferroglobus placidus]ADC64281.1 3-octaprenyl-4-hydroxybenzoate carboxy-lyase [Ferroglobus placidus DSM 10642]
MRIVVALTGASGQIYGIRLLEYLSKTDIETHLVISPAAKENIEIETEYSVEYVESLADFCYDYMDFTAPIASGSFKHDGMIVIPCSIKTASAIANSLNYNLIIRAADVTLKERRKLVLVVRETPLHSGHLRMLAKLSDLGAIVYPPVPAFYSKPKSLDDIVNHTVGRALDLLGVENNLYKPWMGRESISEKEFNL